MEAAQLKKCCKCGEEKSTGSFSPTGGGLVSGGKRAHSWCRACCAKDMRERRARQPDKYRAKVREWSKRNPEKVKARSRRNGLAKKGITVQDYERLFLSQSGRCQICRKTPEEALHRGSSSGRLFVDHCHITGKFRGLLCNGCNAALGHVKDSPEVLRALAAYLESHRSPKPVSAA